MTKKTETNADQKSNLELLREKANRSALDHERTLHELEREIAAANHVEGTPFEVFEKATQILLRNVFVFVDPRIETGKLDEYGTLVPLNQKEMWELYKGTVSRFRKLIADIPDSVARDQLLTGPCKQIEELLRSARFSREQRSALEIAKAKAAMSNAIKRIVAETRAQMVPTGGNAA